MAQTLYHYAGCSTCRKARKWLSQQGQSPVLIPLAAEPPSPERLRALWQASGLPLKKFFNTSGQSYRGGDFKNRLPKMSDDEQLEALAALDAVPEPEPGGESDPALAALARLEVGAASDPQLSALDGLRVEAEGDALAQLIIAIDV